MSRSVPALRHPLTGQLITTHDLRMLARWRDEQIGVRERWQARNERIRATALARHAIPNEKPPVDLTPVEWKAETSGPIAPDLAAARRRL